MGFYLRMQSVLAGQVDAGAPPSSPLGMPHSALVAIRLAAGCAGLCSLPDGSKSHDYPPSESPFGHPPEPVIALRLAHRLLAQLDEAARHNLLTGAERVEVTELQQLGHAGQPLEWVYLPVDCRVSLLSRPLGQRHFEIGLIGFEGMLGAGQALGVSACAFDAVVTGPGRAAPTLSMRGVCGGLTQAWHPSRAPRRPNGHPLPSCSPHIAFACPPEQKSLVR